MGHHVWSARWIWHGPPPIGAPSEERPELAAGAARLVLFRRRFDLEDVPGRAVVRVTADSRYQLLVNGAPLSRGPIRGDPRRLHYDVIDLAPSLRPGPNVLAAVVRFYGEPMAWWQPVPPTYTLGGGAFLLEGELWAGLVDTDRRWESRAAPSPEGDSAVDERHPLVEIVDGRRWDPSWARPGASADDGWQPAHELDDLYDGADGRRSPPSHPYGPLLASPLPQLVGGWREAAVVGRRRMTGGATEGDPVQQVDADSSSEEDPDGAVELLTFDFGAVVAGSLELRVEGSSGVQLDATFAESLRSDQSLARLGQYGGLRYVTRGGDERWRMFDPVGTRYVGVAVRGDAQVQVGIEEAHHRRPEGADFSCSDERLNLIYRIGRRTVDLCAQDAYLDCPTREQRAWTGDAVVHQMVDLASNPDWSLARHHPVLAAAPRPDGMLPMAAGGDIAYHDDTFIPDWALHWVRSVHNLHRWTGDEQLVGSLLPVAEGVLRWFEPFQQDDGLLHDVTGWVLIDWSSLYTSGSSSALNALWARALADFAEMSEWLGDRGRARWARAHHRLVVDGFERFWDPTRQVYLDHLDGDRGDRGGRGGRTAAQHGGAAALAAGLVPAERIGGLVDVLLDRTRLVRRSWVMDTMTPEGDNSGQVYIALPPPAPDWDVEEQMVEMQPFFRYVLHDGLAAAGRAELIADLCLDWQELVDRGETTWPECWRGGTHCHGWSSTPTRDLVWYVLGVQPARPGFAAVSVAPRLGRLDWAQGRVPTPHGPVQVRASRSAVGVESPVPIVCDLGDGGPTRTLPPGRHEIARERPA